jgi:hypothetical protein
VSVPGVLDYGIEGRMMLGVMSAMHEEIDDLVSAIGAATEVVRAGMRTYYRGELWGTTATLFSSRGERSPRRRQQPI